VNDDFSIRKLQDASCEPARKAEFDVEIRFRTVIPSIVTLVDTVYWMNEAVPIILIKYT
jgi:hypothetical protein